jgi:hypothetical protein
MRWNRRVLACLGNREGEPNMPEREADRQIAKEG